MLSNIAPPKADAIVVSLQEVFPREASRDGLGVYAYMYGMHTGISRVARVWTQDMDVGVTLQTWD